MPVAVWVFLGVGVFDVLGIGGRRRHGAKDIVHHGAKHGFDAIVVKQISNRIRKRTLGARRIGKQGRE